MTAGVYGFFDIFLLLCAVVAYRYAAMQWGIRYAGYSGTATTALLYAVPYALAAHILRKAGK